MKEIKAFVGHSFTAADEGVVRKFTDYFDSLKASHSQFSWEHAESAEPRILTEKVLRIISDKNTFIGICTRKEQVAPAAGFLPLLFQSAFWKIKKAQLEWKTSDWIIQEIGLAIGKELNVILLVEEGVRDPGGLQGDIEYIQFKRDNPEQSFGKILQMLSALSPRALSQPPAVSEEAQIENEKPLETQNDSANGVPDASWSRDLFEIAAFSAIGEGDEARLAEVTAAYRSSLQGTQRDVGAAWDVFIEFFRLRVGTGGKLDRLKELVEKNPSSDAFNFLAIIHGSYDQHGPSAEAYMKAAGAEGSAKKKAEYLSKAIKQYNHGNLPKKALEQIAALRSMAKTTPAVECEVLEILLELADKDNDQGRQLALLERLTELRPDDYSARFNLAFKHSEQGRNDLAIYHYRLIPQAERSSTAWNNLGAALDQSDLPAEAVQAYTVAADMDDTLAISNLGYKLMKAGFVKAARLEVDRALKSDLPHKNVGQLLTALQEVPEQEREKQQELVEAAKRRIVFLQQLGAAVASETPSTLPTNWHGPDCAMSLTKNGTKVEIAGSYLQDSSFGLLNALGMGTNGSSIKLKYDVAYSGKLVGRALFGHFERKREGAAVTDSGFKKLAWMFFSSDANELYVLQDADTDSPSYDRLKNVALLGDK